MELKEKLAFLEDIMDVDKDVLKENTKLSELDEWDSLSMLSFVSFMDEEFGRTVKGKDLRSCKTVADLLALME